MNHILSCLLKRTSLCGKYVFCSAMLTSDGRILADTLDFRTNVLPVHPPARGKDGV